MLRDMLNGRLWKKGCLCAGISLAIVFMCSGCSSALDAEVFAPSYDLAQCRMQEEPSLYSFAKELPEMKNIVAVAMRDDEHMILYEEFLEEDGVTLTKKVWLFSVLTGERQMCMAVSQQDDGEYGVAADRYVVYSASPFVLRDIYEDDLYIYSDDLKTYSVMSIPNNEMASDVFVREGSLYYSDWYTKKAYRHPLDELDLSSGAIDYEEFREESENLFKADIYMSDVVVTDVSEDGQMIRISAISRHDGEYHIFDYSVERQEIEEVYTLPEDSSYVWFSWDYDQKFSQVEPSAVARYAYTDYETACEYTVKIEPQSVYDWVMYAPKEVQPQGGILFYVIGEESGKITDVLLWDYKQAEKEAVGLRPEKIPSDYIVGTDYGALTQEAQALEEKYGVDIIFGDNVYLESYEEYTYEKSEDAILIRDTLEQIDYAFDVFPEGMFEEMTSRTTTGFHVYLCTDLMPTEDAEADSAGAFFSQSQGSYEIVLDMNQGGLKETIVHELTHAVDAHIEAQGGLNVLDEEWAMCNPEGFDYLFCYTDYLQQAGGENTYMHYYMNDNEIPEEIYFVDQYSKTYPTEDRARVFEYLVSEDELFAEDIFKEEHMKTKAKLLFDFCSEYFDCFKEDEEYGLKTRAEMFGIY